MSQLEQILAHNEEFVESGAYAEFFTDKFPDRRLAILSCMDTRMIKLLPAALGLKNGDAKLIKKRRRGGQPPVGFGDALAAGGGAGIAR